MDQVGKLYKSLKGAEIEHIFNKFFVRSEKKYLVYKEDLDKVGVFLSQASEGDFMLQGAYIMLPIMDVNRYMWGFVLRSLEGKKFYNYCEFPVPLWGFDLFRGFEFGRTIILVEGIKDCAVMRFIYPYTLAYLTSKISFLKWKVLYRFTDKFLIIPDNDKAGRESIKDLRRNVKILFPHDEVKDISEYIEKDRYDLFKEFIGRMRRML